MRPKYLQAKRELANLQKAEGQAQVPYIAVSERKRQNKKLDPLCVFNGRSTLRNRQIQNANNHHLQAGHQAHHGGVRLLGTKVDWHSYGWQDEKMVRQMVKKDNVGFTLTTA